MVEITHLIKLNKLKYRIPQLGIVTLICQANLFPQKHQQNLFSYMAEIPLIKGQFQENCLKYQNTALATRLDYQKKIINDQKKIITELLDREIRHQKFFQLFCLGWNGFLNRTQRICQMITKNGHTQLESKFENAFQFLDEVIISITLQKIFQSQVRFSMNVDETFKIQISSKFQAFLRLIENIYLEISSDYNNWIEKVYKSYSKSNIILDVEELEQTNYNDFIRGLVSQCQEVITKGKELETSYKNKLKQKEKRISDFDGQFIKESLYKVQQLLADARKENEHLTRRLRMITSYTIKEEEIKKENYDCVCGAYSQRQLTNNAFIKSSFEGEEVRKFTIPSDDKIFQTQEQNANILIVAQLIQKAVRNRNQRVLVQDEDQFAITMNQQELKELESILSAYFTALQNVLKLLKFQSETFQHQNKKLQDQIIYNSIKLKELQSRLDNCHELFFTSPLFKHLQIHNQHLTEQNSALVNQIQILQVSLAESNQKHQYDFANCQKFYESELIKLSNELGMFRQQLGEKKLNEYHQYQQLDVEHIMEGVKERNQQLQKVVDAQMQELQSQKQSISQLREKCEVLEKKKQELTTKMLEYDQKMIAMQSKLPGEFKLEQVQFRHTKHKEFILELQDHIEKVIPQFKEKQAIQLQQIILRFSELSAYLKTRDQRVESLEKQIQQIQKSEISQLKRQQELMLSESEINQNTYKEVHKASKIVEQQLQIKEKSEARLIQEKIAEKAQFENEKSFLTSKIRSSEEVIKRFTNQTNELQQMINILQQEKLMQNDKKNEGIAQFELMKKKYEEIECRYQIVAIEYETLKNKIESKFTYVLLEDTNLINEESVRQYEQAMAQISEFKLVIKQKDEILNDPIKLEQMKGYLILKSENDEEEKLVVSRLKQAACCTECKVNLKEVLISKCMHVLCKECAEKAAFKEQCQICRIKLELSDFWKLKMME